MLHFSKLLFSIAFTGLLCAQTAEDLVSRNLQAKGGIDKIKAIKSMRLTGKFQSGSFTAQTGSDAVAPNLLRGTFTIQGMTAVRPTTGPLVGRYLPSPAARIPSSWAKKSSAELRKRPISTGPWWTTRPGNTIEYL